MSYANLYDRTQMDTATEAEAREQVEALEDAMGALDDLWGKEDATEERRRELTRRMSVLRRLQLKIKRGVPDHQPWTIREAIQREG